MMWKKHWEHHNMCGTPHEDPDFHQGELGESEWFSVHQLGIAVNFKTGVVNGRAVCTIALHQTHQAWLV